MCEGCGGPAAELDHRLAINVARAMGPEALRRAFTLENLHWLCSSCHRRKTRLDRRLARFLSACSLDWRGARRALRLNHRLAINVARAMGPEALRRAFTLENLHWLCSSCHRRKTRLDRRLARFLSACSLDWRGARRALRLNHAWAGVFLAPLGIVDASEEAVPLEDVRTAA